MDSKIKNIDRLISNLLEQKSAVNNWFNSYVFEKLTGQWENNSLKNVNIGWNQDIPDNWSIVPFGKLLQERNQKNIGAENSNRLSLSIGKGVTLYSEKTTNLDRYKDDADLDKYKIAKKWDLVLNSMNMIVGATGISPYVGCVSPAYYTFYDTLQNHTHVRWCDYYMKTKPVLRKLHSLGKGLLSIDRGDDRVNTCRLKICRQDLKHFPIVCPDDEKMNCILNKLDTTQQKIIDELKTIDKMVEKLDNYKNSLIYEKTWGTSPQ